MVVRRSNQNLWQSFADLAMGLMAVFVLILVLLLWQQKEVNAKIEGEKRKVKEEKERIEAILRSVEEQRGALEGERGDFAIELIELFETTQEVVQAQDAAEHWLSANFDEGNCNLRMTPGGELEVVGSSAGAAALYDSGRFAMSSKGRDALASCQQNFLKLAYCLSPVEQVPAEVMERRARYCPEDSLRMSVPIATLRSGVDSLSLVGSTDRIAIGGGTPSIRASGTSVEFEDRTARSFIENAYLGGERARQAMGNLIKLVEHANADKWDALQILMSRVRLESPSFGRYQAGPANWREPGCEGKAGGCAAARNLSLRIRWKKSELRRPFDLVRDKMCSLLAKEDSALARGLRSQGRDLQRERERFRCPARDDR